MCAEYMVQYVCRWPGESVHTDITCTDFMELGNSQVLHVDILSNDCTFAACSCDIITSQCSPLSSGFHVGG